MFFRFKNCFKMPKFTPPRLSEISKKNWRAKVKLFFDTPFMIQIHAESMKKILGAFWIYQLTSADNPANFTQLWSDWLCWLAGRSKRASRILFILSPWLCIINGISKNCFTIALQFFLLIRDEKNNWEFYWMIIN